MKKIIVIASLFLAFSFNASAQEASKAKSVKSVEITPESISKDIANLTKTVTMEESLKKDMNTLLYMRMDALKEVKSEDEKKAIFEMYGKKILGGFTPDQMNQLKSNKELLLKLTQY
jgi:tetrahydrodipicolinate N-succinyltransferase